MPKTNRKLIYIFIKKTIFSQLHTSVVVRQIRVDVLVWCVGTIYVYIFPFESRNGFKNIFIIKLLISGIEFFQLVSSFHRFGRVRSFVEKCESAFSFLNWFFQFLLNNFFFNFRCERKSSLSAGGRWHQLLELQME